MGQVAKKKDQEAALETASSMPRSSSTPENENPRADEQGLKLMLELSRWLKSNCKAEGKPPKSLPAESEDIVISSIIEIRTADDSVILRNEIPFFSALSSSHLPELETDVLNTVEQMLLRPIRSYIHKLASTKVQKSALFRPEHALLEFSKGNLPADLEKSEALERMPFDEDQGPTV